MPEMSDGWMFYEFKEVTVTDNGKYPVVVCDMRPTSEETEETCVKGCMVTDLRLEGVKDIVCS